MKVFLIPAMLAVLVVVGFLGYTVEQALVPVAQQIASVLHAATLDGEPHE